MEDLAKKLGADVFGVADLDLIRDYPTIPHNLLDGFTRGIVVGVKLSDAVFDFEEHGLEEFHLSQSDSEGCRGGLDRKVAATRNERVRAEN